MRLTFFGAARQVTGSMYMLETARGYRLLIDCGMDYEQKRQGADIETLFPFDPATIDMVVLTHAHIDHSGNLPALVNMGFSGHIVCTPATAELTAMLLFDSANIQLNDYRKSLARTRKTRRDRLPKPLYGEKQVKACVDQFYTIPFNKPLDAGFELKVILREAGHLLGAAAVEVQVTENGITKTIGFTGDIGRANSKLVRDGDRFEKADYLVTESTYGGRTHQVSRKAEDELLEYIRQTCVTFNGRLVIPAFSVGRTQAIVFTINQLKKEGLLPDSLKVYVDSPLAVKSTPVYERHPDLLNEEATQFMRDHGSLFHFPGVEYLEGMDEHEELMTKYESCVIVSAAGMVEGGRIQEHVVNNIENPFSTILIAGFCAEGTLGHRLLQGQSTIRIKNKDRMVYARIARTDVFSSHPDHQEILSYVTDTFENAKRNGGQLKRVFLVHGEDPQLNAMHQELSEKLGLNADIPDPGATYQL